MKRAQLGQVFTYLMVLVVIGVLFIFGFQAIGIFITKGEEVEYANFQKKLSNAIEVIRPDFGSVEHRQFVLPTALEEVCFVDKSAALIRDPAKARPLVENSGSDPNIPDNVFLRDNSLIGSFFVGNIEIEIVPPAEGILCFDAGLGSVEIRLEGRGDRTYISRPDPIN